MQAIHDPIPRVIREAAKTPDSPMTDPTERSNPAETKASVIPIAIIPSPESPTAMTDKLEFVKKWGVRTENTTEKPTIMSIKLVSRNEKIAFDAVRINCTYRLLEGFIFRLPYSF
jgi:hypothetical protein